MPEGESHRGYGPAPPTAAGRSGTTFVLDFRRKRCGGDQSYNFILCNSSFLTTESFFSTNVGAGSYAEVLLC